MDFFGEQRIRTRRSLLLYGLFFLVVLVHMAVALGIVVLLSTVFAGDIYHWTLLLVMVWTLGSFAGGSFLEYRRLRAGGRAIAQRVGAVRLFVDDSQEPWEHSHGTAHQHAAKEKVRYSARHIAVRDERDFPPVYRRYYEIAQQLAIASGLRMPILYVLPDEQGINGFVAGRQSQDMVLILTQGAIDKLSDEALYGLIGHEYGHILHGDATFNMQLMVVLAGLQLLYDWSDPISNPISNRLSNYSHFDSDSISQKSLSQRQVDTLARNTEAQTASFTTHSEWVTYWQNQAQQQQRSARRQSTWISAKPVIDRQAPRSIWTLLLHGLSYSSMASAQLIKHSFNRERELLADATSVQLTRTPAIIETLKAIHQDSLGSRLSGIADINGLSHFFFASSGADLGDVSWFATHPSLSERMSAINADAYHDFAVQVAREKRLNQQKIKEIYNLRRLSNHDAVTINSLSERLAKKSQATNISISSNASRQKNDANINTFTTDDRIAQDSHTKRDSTTEHNSRQHERRDDQADVGLEFTETTEIIIDGRLQIDNLPTAMLFSADNQEATKILKPWQAKSDEDLPKQTLIGDSEFQQVTLPQYILDHSYHALGALALIEAVMLCHQRRPLSVDTMYSLEDIWAERLPVDPDSIDTHHVDTVSPDIASPDTASTSDDGILTHKIDSKLLTIVASLDRRLDSSLINFALTQLGQHDLSETAIEKAKRANDRDGRYESHQHYQRQKKCRTMLLRYQQGILELCDKQLTADLVKGRSYDSYKASPNNHTYLNAAFSPHLSATEPKKSPILALWQALHLQPLLPTLAKVLNEHKPNQATGQTPWSQILISGFEEVCAQLDPKKQIFNALNTAEVSILVLLAYRLAKDTKGQITSSQHRTVLSEDSNSAAHYIMDLRRHARLIDIDLNMINDAVLQPLLFSVQHLNSLQLLAVVSAVPIASCTQSPIVDNHQDKQQIGSQIDYNNERIKALPSEYRQWLSTLHTAMLHDTIISQDEYDCLIAMADFWLGVRQLF